MLAGKITNSAPRSPFGLAAYVARFPSAPLIRSLPLSHLEAPSISLNPHWLDSSNYRSRKVRDGEGAFDRVRSPMRSRRLCCLRRQLSAHQKPSPQKSIAAPDRLR